MTNQNKFINAEIPVSNREEAEAAAKKAEELGYVLESGFQCSNECNYFTLFDDGSYGFYKIRDTTSKVIPLSDFLNQPRTETITLDNGEKWRVQLIEKVQHEPMSAEKYYEVHSGSDVLNVCFWMDRYAKYRLEFERKKLTPQ